MIGLGIKTKVPHLKFDAPDDPRFWKAVALTTQRDIRKRTEKKGLDADDKRFKLYSPAYRKLRVSGRVPIKGGGFHGQMSGWPNLSLSAKMLGGMKAIGKKGRARILLTGTQGWKAWKNELIGRTFFALNKKQMERILKSVTKWIVKKNKLK